MVHWPGRRHCLNTPTCRGVAHSGWPVSDMHKDQPHFVNLSGWLQDKLRVCVWETARIGDLPLSGNDLLVPRSHHSADQAPWIMRSVSKPTHIVPPHNKWRPPSYCMHSLVSLLAGSNTCGIEHHEYCNIRSDIWVPQARSGYRYSISNSKLRELYRRLWPYNHLRENDLCGAQPYPFKA